MVRRDLFTRERGAVVAALSLHAMVLALVPRSGVRAASHTVPDDTLQLEVDLDITDEAEPHEDPKAAPLPARTTAPRAFASTRDRASGVATAPSPSPSSAIADPGTSTWTLSPAPTLSIEALSLGTARYRVPLDSPGDDSPGRAATPAFGETSEHDLDLGLGRGGPIRSAVEEAVRTSETTTLGMAIFDVTLDRSGSIRVDLVRAAGSSAPWRELRDPIARLVATKAVRRPEGHGLRVRVRVDAGMKLADGRAAGSLGTRGGVSLGQAGTESVAMKEMPSVGIEQRGTVGSVRLSVSPAGGDLAGATNFGTDSAGSGAVLPSLLTPLTVGGTISPENIGGSPMRRVAVRVLRETTL